MHGPREDARQQAGLQTTADPKVSSQAGSQVSNRTRLDKLQFRAKQREGTPEHHLQSFNESLSTMINNRLRASWLQNRYKSPIR